MNKHTPTPWQVSKTIPKDYPDKISIDGADGSFVALVDSRGIPGMQEANTDLIVRAVNSFDAMREALEKMLYNCGRCDGGGLIVQPGAYKKEYMPCPDCKDARAALKLADENP